MKKMILSIVVMVSALISIVSAQSISITAINPSSITTVKNQEFSAAVTYTITGTFDSCHLKVDETNLPAGWQLTEVNPKQIDCSSGTSNIPKILATTSGSTQLTIIVEGKGISPRQDSENIYVTVKEGAILDGTLISPSNINVEKGMTYTIEFNVKNNGDMDSENAVAIITCPSGYSCPSSLILKEGQQASGVIRAGYTAYASFEIKAENPTTGDIVINISATNSMISDEIKVSLSYRTVITDSERSIFVSGAVKKLKNATLKLALVPGIGLRNNTKLQDALAKVFGITKLSEESIENMMKLSKSIISDIEISRKFKAAEGKSTLSMIIKYKGAKKVKNFIIWDKIPKTFANSSDLINVSAPGAIIEIVDSDPEYVFVYSEVNPDQELVITYETTGEKDANLLNETEIEIYAEELVTPQPTICTTGEKRCVGNNLQICKNNQWQTIETCEYGCDNSTLSCKQKLLKEIPSKKDVLNYLWIVIVIALIIIIYYSKFYKK